MEKKIKNNSIEGIAFVNEENDMFSFSPYAPMTGWVKGFRKQGTAQQLTDGTFEFVPRENSRKRCKLIMKLPHGRLSQSTDSSILLTLRVYPDECVDIAAIIAQESFEAAAVMMEMEEGK